MMLCVDKKMLRDSRLDHESGPLPAGARPRGNGAADVYPATDTAFVIQSLFPNASSPTVTFAVGADGPSSITPLSAGGTLLVDAANILQDGELQAPFGQIILGITSTSATPPNIAIGAALGGFNNSAYAPAINTSTLTLDSGSVTSVSAHGITIPYGSTVDQSTWPSWSGSSGSGPRP